MIHVRRAAVTTIEGQAQGAPVRPLVPVGQGVEVRGAGLCLRRPGHDRQVVALERDVVELVAGRDQYEGEHEREGEGKPDEPADGGGDSTHDDLPNGWKLGAGCYRASLPPPVPMSGSEKIYS